MRLETLLLQHERRREREVAAGGVAADRHFRRVRSEARRRDDDLVERRADVIERGGERTLRRERVVQCEDGKLQAKWVTPLKTF